MRNGIVILEKMLPFYNGDQIPDSRSRHRQRIHIYASCFPFRQRLKAYVSLSHQISLYTALMISEINPNVQFSFFPLLCWCLDSHQVYVIMLAALLTFSFLPGWAQDGCCYVVAPVVVVVCNFSSWNINFRMLDIQVIFFVVKKLSLSFLCFVLCIWRGLD